MMHAADQISEGKDQPSSNVTSGPRYCRVFTIFDFFLSSSYVAPPKSITYEFYSIKSNEIEKIYNYI
jgi:hypothetical protein